MFLKNRTSLSFSCRFPIFEHIKYCMILLLWNHSFTSCSQFSHFKSSIQIHPNRAKIISRFLIKERQNQLLLLLLLPKLLLLLPKPLRTLDLKVDIRELVQEVWEGTFLFSDGILPLLKFKLDSRDIWSRRL